MSESEPQPQIETQPQQAEVNSTPEPEIVVPITPTVEAAPAISEIDPAQTQQEISGLKQQLEETYNASEESETKQEVKEFVGDVNKLFGKKYSLSVPEDNLPNIVVAPVDSPAYVEKNEDGSSANVIEIKRATDVLDGEVMGEEMSHFYRAQFRPDHSEALTDEFFGFLGRRMLYEATANESGESDFFNRGKPNIAREFLGTKGMVVDKLKAQKEALRNLTSEHAETTDETRKQQIIEQGAPIVEYREDILQHYRGYEFASKVDLNRINNWQELYSMPDRDVRMRFFTPNPDYSGL